MLLTAIALLALNGPGIVMRDVSCAARMVTGGPDTKATVAFISLAECPIARKYASEIRRICKEYEPKGVRAYLVLVDPDLDAKSAQRHAKEFGLTMPVILDKVGTFARRAEAKAVPTAAVFGHDGRLMYSGRIDDRFPALGVERAQPRTHDLCNALDAVLAGRQPKPARTEVVGCLLPKS